MQKNSSRLTEIKQVKKGSHNNENEKKCMKNDMELIENFKVKQCRLIEFTD